MTPLESELMKFVEKWRRVKDRSSFTEEHDGYFWMGYFEQATSDMLTELELILSIEKEK